MAQYEKDNINNMITKKINEIKERADYLMDDSNHVLQAFMMYIENQNKMRVELQTLSEETSRLKLELERKKDTIKNFNQKFNTVNALINNEKSLASAVIQEKEHIKNAITRTLNIVVDKKTNVPIELQEQIARTHPQFKETETDSSDLEMTSSNFSAGTTESDDYHLFPELVRRKKNSNDGSRNNGIASGVNQYVAMARERTSGYSTSGTISTLFCEFNDSNKSNLQLFSIIMDRFKNSSHDLKFRNLILGEKCSVCAFKIPCGRKAFKCAECRTSVHEQCAEKIPKPCIPMKPLKPQTYFSIADYCPDVRPNIPAIIIHCLSQIEQRGLNEAALYKLPVCDSRVRSLKEQLLKNKGLPNLSQISIETICAFVKDFFGSLKPGLISQQIFNQFVDYFKKTSKDVMTYAEIYNIMLDLPVCNKHTFVFLIMHLQKVSSSTGCKMSTRSLSRIFTPLLIDKFAARSYEEEKSYFVVTERLIKMPNEIWASILLNAF